MRHHFSGLETYWKFTEKGTWVGADKVIYIDLISFVLFLRIGMFNL